MSEKNNTIAQLEAMLFAAGDPVEPEKLADVLELDIENVIKMLGYLEAKYDESGSGLRLIRVDGKYQICTREAYADGVRALLEIKKNTPLSPAAFEVLAIVAYNKAVTRSFVEQVRGVDCSGPISGLVQKGLIEEKGRLDLPGRPLVYGTTDRFLRCFSLNSHPQKRWSRSPRITARPPCLRKRAARTTRWLQRQTHWKVPIMTMKKRSERER